MPRILVIDDDPMYRDMVSEVLSEEGHETLLAVNGLEGIDKARAYVPDLVISDVVMDGADGYQVLQTLRSEPATAVIPVIMMTGYSSKGGHRQGMTLGADDYLPKPFNATELLNAVGAQLRKRYEAASIQTRNTTTTETGVSVLLPAELSEPLRSISGFAQLLTSPNAPLEARELRRVGEQLGAAAWRMRRAVDNFSLFYQLSRLEKDTAARAHLSDAELPSVEAFLRNHAMALAKMRGRQTDLKLDIKDGTITMGSDYLGRILTELLDNAFTYSQPGQHVEVVAAFAPQRFGLAVTDHGKGMSAEEIARVDAFTQFGERDVNHPGLGLGLAICRKIALLHGGGMSIKSKEGEKTRVAVELPVRS